MIFTTFSQPAGIRSGYDLGTVDDILGHANVSTTAIYMKPSLRDKARALEISEV